MTSVEFDNLASDTQIILNCTGNQQFDERVSYQVKHYSQIPYEILAFAKQCPQLQSFVHLCSNFGDWTSRSDVESFDFEYD